MPRRRQPRADFRAGTAVADISPLPAHRRGLYLGGYDGYRGRPAAGLHDPLFSRALILSDGSTTLALVSLDLVGITNAHLRAIRREAAASTGIAPANILLASTHSHASPDLQGLWGGVPGDYAAHLRRQAVRSIREAAADLRQASLRCASGRIDGLTYNRRGWDHTDPTLTVLQASGTDGSVIATVVNFACHPTVLSDDNLEMSRDFPGVLVDRLQEALGGTAIFVNADQGDANPAAHGAFDQMTSFAEAAAQQVIAALDKTQPLPPPLRLQHRALAIPLGNPRMRLPPALLLRGLIAGLGTASRLGLLPLLARWSGQEAMGRAQTLAGFAMLAEHPLQLGEGRPRILTRASHLRIGHSLSGLTAPGEVLTRLGLPLRERLGTPCTLFLGLTHDTLGYFVPADEWMTGHNNNYEESVSLGPEAAPALEQAAIALLASP